MEWEASSFYCFPISCQYIRSSVTLARRTKDLMDRTLLGRVLKAGQRVWAFSRNVLLGLRTGPLLRPVPLGREGAPRAAPAAYSSDSECTCCLRLSPSADLSISRGAFTTSGRSDEKSLFDQHVFGILGCLGARGQQQKCFSISEPMFATCGGEAVDIEAPDRGGSPEPKHGGATSRAHEPKLRPKRPAAPSPPSWSK